jgi:GH35 family endo-1,4-beta-xylanase
MKSPESLHPEVFEEVWHKWSILCANHEAKMGSLTKTVEDKLWEAAVKITDYNIRLDWNSFCRTHGLGVYK